MRLWFRRWSVAGMGVAVVILVAACGNDAPPPDFGPYSTVPGDNDFDRTPSRGRGIFAESLRLADHIVFPTDIDGELTTVRGGGVSADDRGLHETAFSPRQRTIAVSFGVVGSFGLAAANRADNAAGPQKYLAVSLTAFRDEASAAAAATEMARLDAEAGPGKLAGLKAWKNVVIRVYVELPDPDPARLAALVATTFRKQEDQLAGFDTAAVPDPATVPLDPDGLLTRLVRTGDPVADPKTFAAFGIRAYAALSPEPARKLTAYSGNGVTALAVSHNKFLYRMRDSKAATSYADWLSEDPENSEYTWMRNARDLPGARCSAAARPDPKSVQARRFRCVVTRGEYVAVVYSNTETDIRQLAAAQYAIMAGAR
ncbi:DUF7373 family lipoprotein [Nocardia concava]|uniref:DUF7373 family lipoprotein n=1 Tax=Nocardia concava TaxID=257281 RepID=UPI000593CD9B|nr:hypothetical protein [Nocardia concava]